MYTKRARNKGYCRGGSDVRVKGTSIYKSQSDPSVQHVCYPLLSPVLLLHQPPFEVQPSKNRSRLQDHQPVRPAHQASALQSQPYLPDTTRTTVAMQFSTLAAISTLAGAVSAAPSATLAARDTCVNTQVQACCDATLLSCLVQILGAECSGEAYCCSDDDSDSGALINIDLLNCVQL
ncbi:hypothetical protein GGR56DRAFT_661338 [Xylariaceae sp. FL0804]|nr:hypothetical protein GGR56DRAFT_661338 [Xylariaceae sp. FL0804]